MLLPLLLLAAAAADNRLRSPGHTAFLWPHNVAEKHCLLLQLVALSVSLLLLLMLLKIAVAD